MTNARLVILFLGVLALLDVAIIGLLAVRAQAIPVVLPNLAFGAVAALGAILAKTSSDTGVNVEAAQNVNAGDADKKG